MIYCKFLSSYNLQDLEEVINVWIKNQARSFAFEIKDVRYHSTLHQSELSDYHVVMIMYSKIEEART